MVEAEPGGLDFRLKRGQSLVDGRPVSEFLQSCRPSLPDGLVKMVHALVIDIMVEVNVSLDHCVILQEPSYFRNGIAAVVVKYRAGGEGRLQKDLDSVQGNAGPFGDLLCRKALRLLPAGFNQKLENAVFHHQAADLEHYGCEGYGVRRPLSFQRSHFHSIILGIHIIFA